eukprot:Lithocolla_globosa_v1_NODE_223_length_5052_cov_23.804283.p4 type:complete len:114 gc:universal NODE_223_length_5052_cov_23.804283:4418-4759(+)
MGKTMATASPSDFLIGCIFINQSSPCIFHGRHGRKTSSKYQNELVRQSEYTLDVPVLPGWNLFIFFDWYIFQKYQSEKNSQNSPAKNSCLFRIGDFRIFCDGIGVYGFPIGSF